MADSSIAWILAFSTFSLGQNVSSPLTVAAKLQSRSVYVGQAIELQVAVVAGAERPKVEPPIVDGADLVLFGNETQAISVSAIGDQVREQTVYRFRYRLLPRKVGTLVIPSVTASLPGSRGASAPLKLRVNELPREDRTADFLGGVGGFELAAMAKPVSIRLGQDFEYRIEVKGTAARGIREAPSLERLTRSHPGLKIERLPDESIDEPPLHAFTWRIRPRTAADLRLPPVSIAAFDPKIARYLTRATTGLSVKVSDVLMFDPKSIDYSPMSPARGEFAKSAIGRTWLSLLIGSTSLLAVGIAFRRYRRGSRQYAARRLLKAFQQRLTNQVEAHEIGPLINQIFKDYLAFRQVHSTGALTPGEAKSAVEQLTSSTTLGSRAEELVTQSDRLCFSGQTEWARGGQLKETALRLLEDLIEADRRSPRANPSKTRKS